MAVLLVPSLTMSSRRSGPRLMKGGASVGNESLVPKDTHVNMDLSNIFN